MRPPVMVGTIDRRVLLNYQVDPEVAAHCLPPPFRPALEHGVAIAGICLIRFRGLRPERLPRVVGVRSENIAHRIAVEWDGPAGVEVGVFIPRRDTSSVVSRFLGGRLFPGPHSHGRFDVDERGDLVHIRYRSDDRDVSIEVRGRQADRLPERSVFGSLDEASAFFRRGSVGYSPTRAGCSCDAVELEPERWSVHSLDIECAHSSWFDDESHFPRGSIALDSALVMRGIPARWIALDEATPMRKGCFGEVLTPAWCGDSNLG